RSTGSCGSPTTSPWTPGAATASGTGTSAIRSGPPTRPADLTPRYPHPLPAVDGPPHAPLISRALPISWTQDHGRKPQAGREAPAALPADAGIRHRNL